MARPRLYPATAERRCGLILPQVLLAVLDPNAVITWLGQFISVLNNIREAIPMLSFSKLSTPTEFNNPAKINGRKVILRLLNLSTNPEAMRLMDKQQRAVMDGGKMKHITDLMPEFEEKETSDMQFANMAIKGWKMNNADVAHFDFDKALAADGVWKEYDIGQDAPLRVRLRSANTREMREMSYNFNTRALQGIDLRGAPIPPLDKQLWTKANRLKRLIADWEVAGEDGKKQPITEEAMMSLVRVAVEVTNDMLADAEDDTNFCVAAGKSPEELAELAKTEYPFNADNRDHLVRHCIPLREHVLNVARDEAKARQSAAAETAKK